MAHPRMYVDADPRLGEVRRIALGFPEAVEVEAWGRPTFRAGKKMFAIFGGDDQRPATVIFKTDPAEHRALADDARFFGPAYFDRRSWIALDLTIADVDWDEVAELLDTSYRQVALKRMLRALDLSRGFHADERGEGSGGIG